MGIPEAPKDLRFRPVVGRTGSRAVGRMMVVPDRKPDTTDQLRQRIPRRPSHIDGARGVDCGPTGGLADGEEAAYALDPDAARRCCSTRAVRYSTENWANTPDGRPPNHRRCWRRRHEHPGSFQSRFKCNSLLYLNRGLPGSAVYDLSADRQAQQDLSKRSWATP